MGVEDAVRPEGGACVEGAGLLAGRSRRRGGGAAGGARDEGVIAEIALPGVRRSVGCARGAVREALLGRLRPGDPLLDDVVTVVSETVSNAIRHTASGLEGGRVAVVLAARGGTLRLEVADDGAAGARPHVREEPTGETGRGMRIVEALASRWGFRAEGRRTVMWAEFPAPPRP